MFAGFRVWFGGARFAAGALLLLLLSGCAGLVPQTMGLRDAWPQGIAERSEVRGVPFFPQQEYECGPAALATSLGHGGILLAPEDLAARVYLPGREGSLQPDMLAAPRRYGRVTYQLAPRFDDLLREVAAGNPVIVLQDIGIGPFNRWHYAVVVGFDYPAGALYLRSGTVERLEIPFTIFEHTWKQSGYWAMVIMAPGHLPATADERRYVDAIAAMERVGDDQSVRVAYSAALQQWPGNVVASTGLANRHYAAGELPAAEAVLRRALALQPQSGILANNLAQTLSDLGRDAEALKIIDMVPVNPDSQLREAVADTRTQIVRRLAGQR